MYRSRASTKPQAWLTTLGILFPLLWLGPNVATTIPFSPSRSYKLTQATIQASPLKTNGYIAFSSDRNGFRDIYVMNPDGSNQRQLTFGAKNPANGYQRTYTSDPIWSPDGTKIAFLANLDYKHRGLYVMKPDGTRITQVTTRPSMRLPSSRGGTPVPRNRP